MTTFPNVNKALSGITKFENVSISKELDLGGRYRSEFGKRTQVKPAVFDHGKSRPVSPAAQMGLASANVFSGFRRCPADDRPARSTVTAQVLGDPRPGQFNHKPLWRPAEREIRQ